MKLSRNLVIDSSVSRYLLTGIANTFTGLSIIYLAKWLASMNDIAANALGYGIGLILSFVLNKRWTFQHVGPAYPAIIRFLVVIGAAYVANLIVVITSIDVLQINSYVAQAIGIVPYTVIGYLGSRFFAFSENAYFKKGS